MISLANIGNYYRFFLERQHSTNQAAHYLIFSKIQCGDLIQTYCTLSLLSLKKIAWFSNQVVYIVIFKNYYIFMISPTHIPGEAGRKLTVHKTFRRRPGRLLNVVCTFNSRPVSTGVGDDYVEVFRPQY